MPSGSLGPPEIYQIAYLILHVKNALSLSCWHESSRLSSKQVLPLFYQKNSLNQSGSQSCTVPERVKNKEREKEQQVVCRELFPRT